MSPVRKSGAITPGGGEKAKCDVCHGVETREELVDAMFRIEGQDVMVDGVPAVVCGQCGERTFSCETAEKVRLMVHGEGKAARTRSVQVFRFAR